MVDLAIWHCKSGSIKTMLPSCALGLPRQMFGGPIYITAAPRHPTGAGRDDLERIMGSSEPGAGWARVGRISASSACWNLIPFPTPEQPPEFFWTYTSKIADIRLRRLIGDQDLHRGMKKFYIYLLGFWSFPHSLWSSRSAARYGLTGDNIGP